MNETTFTDKTDFNERFFDENYFGAEPLTHSSHAALQNNAAAGNNALDKLLIAFKLLFLYLPGAATIHFIMMLNGLFISHSVLTSRTLLREFSTFAAGTFMFYAVSAFMIMLGLGKLTDLKYLKVVGAISTVSLLTALLYALSAFFIPTEFFGLFSMCTLPLTTLAGYAVKKNLDKQNADD